MNKLIGFHQVRQPLESVRKDYVGLHNQIYIDLLDVSEVTEVRFHVEENYFGQSFDYFDLFIDTLDIESSVVDMPVLQAIRSTGATTLEALTQALNQRGIRSARGGR